MIRIDHEPAGPGMDALLQIQRLRETTYTLAKLCAEQASELIAKDSEIRALLATVADLQRAVFAPMAVVPRSHP